MRYICKRQRMRLRPDKYLWYHASQWFNPKKYGVDNHFAMESLIYTQEIDGSTFGPSETKPKKG